MITPVSTRLILDIVQSPKIRMTMLSPRGNGWHVWDICGFGYYIKDGIYSNGAVSYQASDYMQTFTGEIRFYMPDLQDSACLLAPALGVAIGNFSEVHEYLSANKYEGYHVVFFDTVTGYSSEKDISGMVLAASPTLYPSNRHHLQFSVETIFSTLQKAYEDVAEVRRFDGSLESFPGVPKDPGARAEIEKWLRYAAAMFFSLSIKL